ncbi:MAG: hypothetical protein AB7L66_03330 [Gemmatimonadales bacterium]
MVAELMLGAGLLFGCGGTPMDQQIPVSRGRGYTVALDTLGASGIVGAPAARVWQAVHQVLPEFGIDINFREPETLRVGGCYQKVRTRLGKELLSALLDCGDSRGVPNADRYEIGLTVLATVEPTGPTTSQLHIFVLGVGLDASGAASNRLWCYSKGVLEERIRAVVEQRARA